ncbi:UDP-2,3-diacylglucosamine diphosphatase [Marinobacterium sp. D7]|uniref:UDP-2,3-diacylglucosamine diphosphatase n=1 Tax=Marinobacterium ramblicola TaxID=2849041 RepID=UPI001C2DC7D0|nr:UDP-2,3-diacylglucosamine diphosphatase [Marinobacterium ramblicola]MBV1786573.1 UDP-2,3-diacylglucosamine diphosphatase [Marinobacterium ramblicola]
MRQLFIADLHLQPERPELFRAFRYFLDSIARPGDTLYMLGDIFEYWIGDDAPLPGLEPIFQRIRALSDAGSHIYFQHGNRDFLVGQTLMSRLGAELLPEAQRIELPTGAALVMHGDQLCTDDTAYQQFRTQVRDPQWQQRFLSQPAEQREAIARQMRQQSQQQGAMKTETIMDVNADAVRQTMLAHGVELLIHGHTHRPHIHQHQIAPNRGERIVLGDWSESGWYLLADESGRELIRFTPGLTPKQDQAAASS